MKNGCRDACLAVSSLYGIDLLPDNIEECRARLLEGRGAEYSISFKRPLADAVARVVEYNSFEEIVQGDALTLCTAAGLRSCFRSGPGQRRQAQKEGLQV